MRRLFIIIILATLTAPGMSMSKISSKMTEKEIDLGDYPDSVDDPFDGCKEEMRKLIRSDYLEKELKEGDTLMRFNEHWKKDTLHLQLQNVSDEELRNLTLKAYSGSFNKIINPKMRTGRKAYRTTFGLISLHFLITEGIQHLNPDNKCQTTYRFGKEKYVIKGDKMRFGSFTSSSRDPGLRKFGRVTCFIIETCFGADLSELSHYDDEAEVLIPPYEEFNNVALPEIPKDLKDCGRVYKLKSTKVKKNKMDCKLFPKRKMETNGK